jgi:hypothetical protein
MRTSGQDRVMADAAGADEGVVVAFNAAINRRDVEG